MVALHKYYRRIRSNFADSLEGDNDPDQLAVYAGNADEKDTAYADAEELEDVFVHLMDLEEGIIQQSTPADSSKSVSGTATGSERDSPHAFLLRSCISADIYALTAEPFSLQRYADDSFYGIMVDTGCSFSSTAGIAQCLVYCKHVGIPANID